MNIHVIYGFFMARFRPARAIQLRKLFPCIDGQASIIDVGGATAWWKHISPKNDNITIINIDDVEKKSIVSAGFKFLKADARKLPFKDQEFDFAISNSVIEHVGNLTDQKSFAREIQRCAKTFYVQTPNKWFPIEPHFLSIFIHWLPKSAQIKMARRFTLWGWIVKPSPEEIRSFIENTRLLSEREFRALFPNCQIIKEKFMGLTKSFIAIRQ